MGKINDNTEPTKKKSPNDNIYFYESFVNELCSLNTRQH